MRYIEITYTCGYAGCDEEYYIQFSDNTEDSEIDTYAQDGFENYCYDVESVIGPREDYATDEEYDEVAEDFYSSCMWDWREVEDEDEINQITWDTP